jgi:hypothetical protein
MDKAPKALKFPGIRSVDAQPTAALLYFHNLGELKSQLVRNQEPIITLRLTWILWRS